MSNDYSSNSCDMVQVEEVGGFLLRMQDSQRIVEYNASLQERSIKVINWLKHSGAPAEMVEEAIADNAAGNNAIITVIREIRATLPEMVVIPRDLLELILEAAGPQAAMLFCQICEEETGYSPRRGGKDYREKQGRQ